MLKKTPSPKWHSRCQIGYRQTEALGEMCSCNAVLEYAQSKTQSSFCNKTLKFPVSYFMVTSNTSKRECLCSKYL